MNWYKKSQNNQSNQDDQNENDKFQKSPVPHIPLHEKGGYQEGKKREEILYNAIKKLAEEWNIGPIKPLRIDARGDITMIQDYNASIEYVNPEEIDPKLIKIAVDYDNYNGEVGGRWIKMNHFTWEKMLGDMRLLPRHITTQEEFLKDIGK